MLYVLQRKQWLGLCSVLIVAATSVSSALADVELLTNGNFESPGLSLAPTYFRYYTNGDTYSTGWTVNLDGSGEASYLVQRGGSYDPYIIAGNYGLILKEGDTLSTTVALIQNANYTLSFYTMANSGGEDFNALHVNVGGNAYAFDPTVFPASTQFTTTFTASTTGNSTLSFQLISSQTYHSVSLDSISFSTVPEPATEGVMAGLGVLGWAIVGRRRIFSR